MEESETPRTDDCAFELSQCPWDAGQFVPAGVCRTMERETVALSAQVRELREERDRAEDALRHHGYRKTCDIPACNCGDQWFHGGNASMRLMEIADELGERTQGKTILQALKELEQSLATAREEAATTALETAAEEAEFALKQGGNYLAGLPAKLRALKPTTEAGGGET
jgi:hypothetical protein